MTIDGNIISYTKNCYLFLFPGPRCMRERPFKENLRKIYQFKSYISVHNSYLAFTIYKLFDSLITMKCDMLSRDVVLEKERPER